MLVCTAMMLQYHHKLGQPNKPNQGGKKSKPYRHRTIIQPFRMRQLTQWFSQLPVMKAVPNVRAGFIELPVYSMVAKWPTVTDNPMANGAMYFESGLRHTHKIDLFSIPSSLRNSLALSILTRFIAVTHTEHGEDENESEEKFQSQALHRCHFFAQKCVAQCTVERWIQKRFN